MSRRVVADHADWLALVEPAGPFLTLPVLARVFPNGLDRTPANLRAELRERVEGLPADEAARYRFVEWVLRRFLAYGPTLREGQSVPATLMVTLPEHASLLRPDFALVEPSDETTARVLVKVWPARTDFTEHVPEERWAASPIDRMATLCRETGVQLGLVTDGDRFVLLWVPRTGPVGRATWSATICAEPREATLLDSFASLLGARRLFSVADPDRLEALLSESASAQADVTIQLGRQVRRAVEMLVAAFSHANIERGGALLAGLDPHQVYEAACTVLMRLVFLLYAEERRLLPLDDGLYASSYAVSTLRQELRETADAIGNEETLEHSRTAWPRLLATSRAVHAGLTHDQLRIPAYGGRLFDPDRFGFLEGRTAGESWRNAAGEPIPVDDRTMLSVLTALQILEMREGGVTEARRLSFRSLDVEQIGHVYEGLLDHGTRRIDTYALGLVGKPGDEPEIALEDLETRTGPGGEDLASWLAERTGRSHRQVTSLLEEELDERRYRAVRVACHNDAELLERVRPYANLVRDDIRGIPMVLHPGDIFVTEVSHRRDTGTEYTTKELADEVVRYALEPLVYHPGPAEGAAPAEWRLKRPAEILDLKVCDPAVGSGAIITAACRYLADRLVEAQHEHVHGAETRRAGEPRPTAPPFADPAPGGELDDVVIAARRSVAERCLYGVDRDPMAVEMAKLSLWLVTMAKDRPFSFLDHAFCAGDSLLGVTSLEQVTRLHPAPEAAVQPLSFAGDLEPLVKEAVELRTRLEDVPVRELRDVEEKARLLARAEAAMRTATVLADLVAGAALATAGTRQDPGTRLATVSGAVRQMLALPPEARASALGSLADQAQAWLNERRPEGVAIRRPLHWPLAFPEVFCTAAGRFDACVGNPPFLGGKRISTANGSDYREYLVSNVAAGRKGSADLSALFFLRAARLAERLGFLATNTISQGDTREVGLDQLTKEGWTIVRADKSTPWPGAASLEIAKVWATGKPWRGPAVLEGAEVRAITSALAPAGRVSGEPRPLKEEKRSFIGSFVNGVGFILSPEEAKGLIAKDLKNRDVLFPYLTGEDLNTRPDGSASRWIINFFDWPRERAERYDDCYAIVRERVWPVRAKVNRKAHRERWWQYGDKRPELYSRIHGLTRVLVLSRVGRAVQPVFVATNQVFSDALVVFAYDDDAHFALLSSALHWWWAVTYASTMRTDVRYTPSDCFETFPRPRLSDEMRSAGQALDLHRQAVLRDRELGLTKVYNLLGSEADTSADIEQLRALHRSADEAVATAYGWDDLELGHGFYETSQGTRWTLSPVARREVLDRLLELNHERSGATAAPRRRPERPPTTHALGGDGQLALPWATKEAST